MTSFLLQAALLVALVTLIAKPMGLYLWHVFTGERTWLDPVLRPIERLAYRACRIDPEHGMAWGAYAGALLAFNAVGIAMLYVMLRVQGALPLDPQHNAGQSALIALNTAVSFVTNTNWQAYAGENGATYLTQMLGLTWQNFVSAATGLAAAVAFVRGLTRQSVRDIGNFWSDLVRGTLWVLLPISLVLAVFLASQGVVQTLAPSLQVRTVEGSSQTIARGPVASQEAIKELGANGGGFFNANSAHPYENPSPLTDFVEILAMLAIPAGLTYMFGKHTGDQRQGWAVFGAMLTLYVALVSGIFLAERAGNPNLAAAGAEQSASADASGGNMEGKEVRFGTAASSLFAGSTTAVACGAVNGMHDSLTPLGGGLAMLAIGLGEVVFGGVGAGLIGMLLYALLAVFIAGLMVGRTPEYLGKKIGAREIQMAILALLVVSIAMLGFSALATATPAGLAGRLNAGPHGFTEILYAFSSGAGNNGSAFAGLAAGSPFYALTVAIAMLVGRFLFIVPALALAGSMGRKQSVAPSAGTFPTNGSLFVILLIGTVLIVGALTFFPAYSLGPVIEHFLMHAGRLF